MYSFVPITDKIIDELLENITKDNIEELQLLTYNEDIADTVKKTVELSEDSWACYYNANGKLCGIWGVGRRTLASNDGQIWVLLTDEAKNHVRPLLVKAAKIGIAYYLGKYTRLINYVPSSYVTGLRWLKMLGFEITPVTATLSKIEMR